MARPYKIDYNKVYYNTKNKAFKVIKELEPYYVNNKLCRKILIKFIESGYETETFLSKLHSNPVPITDYLSPSVYDVGIVGYADPILNKSMYKRWASMLARCYNPNNERYCAYGAKGVTVCERWKRFDYFLNDIPFLPGYNDMINNPNIKYQLDKDILQQGIPANQKVYSPTTCMFVPETQNNIQRIIDNKPNYINNQYYGVQKNKAGNHTVRIRVGDKNVNCGTYTNIIAAANVYNYFAKLHNKQIFNDVEYMSRQECAEYLVQLIPMLVENKTYGVKQISDNNYMVRMSVNNNQASLGVYTNMNAALNAYNHFSFGMGRRMPNNVVYMSPQECANYLVKPRQMCTIVDK